MTLPTFHPVIDLILGQDKAQRVRISQVLLVLGLDVMLFCIAGYGVLAGLLDGVQTLAWLVFTLAGLACFYVAIRSGFNLRFPADPALTLPQAVVSVITVVGCYMGCGPVRGSILLTLAVTLMFGMFKLTPRQARGLSLFAVLLLGAAMAFSHQRWPDRFPAREEIMHFMLVAVLLPTLAYLAGQLSGLRHKLKLRSDDLTQALEQISQLAIRDELTGLYNRRHMNELMAADVKRARRTGKPTSLVLIDIDHFKRVNDVHGHGAGDEVLRRFARSAREALRDTDTVGRWGGEEFIVMLPDTLPEDAFKVIARVHRALAEARFDSIDPALQVRCSAGIAAGLPDEPWAATVERADQAMYVAKEAGRNQTRLAPAALAPELPGEPARSDKSMAEQTLRRGSPLAGA